MGVVAVRWVRFAVMLFGLIALVTAVGQIRVRAQEADDLAALSAQVSQLHGQGKYAEAFPIAERYVALARQKHAEDHPEFATAISWLAKVYGGQGRYADAEPLFKHALAIVEEKLGPDHSQVGDIMNDMASLYMELGRC
jgi:tetratricopeptide (TPR) repeat protein